MTPEEKRDLEELKAWKKSLEASYSFPLNMDQALVGRGFVKAKLTFFKTILDFGSIAAGANATLTVTLPAGEMKPNDIVIVSGIDAYGTGRFFSGYVSSGNSLTVRGDNYSASAVDPSSAEFNILVISLI